jgi:hypothetical protein
MENKDTKEKLVVKKTELSGNTTYQKIVLISRYSLDAGKQWIEANEQEVMDWDFDTQNDRIYVDHPRWYEYGEPSRMNG